VSNTSPEGSSPRIFDMKIIDLIPSIPLHNLGKTAVTKKVLSKTVEREVPTKNALHRTAGYPTLSRLHGKMRPRLTGLPYLADRAPHLGGLPHLPGVPHLHVNGPFFPAKTIQIGVTEVFGQVQQTYIFNQSRFTRLFSTTGASITSRNSGNCGLLR